MAYPAAVLPFSKLLAYHLARLNLSAAEFARRVDLTPATVSRILSERRKPWFERGVAWADALGLEGREREDFLDAMAIAASPLRVATIIARLGRQRH